MTLVDTSIWIRALAGRQPFATGLAELLTNDDVLSHDLVHGELLIGDPSGRRVLSGGYLKLHRAATLPHAEVVAFVRGRKLAGKGIGWIDAHLLASAVVEHARLWTADRNLAAVAEGLRVAHV